MPTQRPEPPDTGNLSFGQPRGLLGSHPDQGQDQDTTWPMTPSRDTRRQSQQPFILDRYGLRGDYNSSFHLQFQGEEAVAPPIPSSKTPSPMKLPSEGSMGSVVSLSPMKIDQALQESVTSLLGKRLGENEGGRQGKRSRPQRRVSFPVTERDIALMLNLCSPCLSSLLLPR